MAERVVLALTKGVFERFHHGQYDVFAPGRREDLNADGKTLAGLFATDGLLNDTVAGGRPVAGFVRTNSCQGDDSGWNTQQIW